MTILPQNNQDQNPELCFKYQSIIEHNPQISLYEGHGVEESKGLVSQFLLEKAQDKSTIILDYGDGCIKKRYWNKASNKKTFAYYQDEKKGKGTLTRWKPYNWQSFIAPVPICVEGEKAAIFGLSKGLPCFSIPFTSKEYLEQISPILSAMTNEFIFLYDNDDAGLKNALRLQRYFLENGIAKVFIFNTADIFTKGKSIPKYDIADFIETYYEFCGEELIQMVNAGIEDLWEDSAKQFWSVFESLEQKENPSKVEGKTLKNKKKDENELLSNPHHKDNNNGSKNGNGNGNGNKSSIALNAIREHFKGKLEYNELLDEIEYDRKSFYVDDFYLTLALDYGVEVQKTTAYDLVVKEARNHSYNPVIEYLEACKSAVNDDDELDITQLSTLLLGTKNELYDQYLYRHILGSVKRMITPGYKKDECLILKGKQGINKSSFFAALYGFDFFDDSISGTDKDDLLIAHRSWCLELAEIEYITKRKESGELKNFLSRNADTFRTPYDRRPKTLPRKFVFVGSVNEDCFLKDPTGNRRFWVIESDYRIDLDKVKELRDRIWGIAYHHLDAGETPQLPFEFWTTQEEMNKSHIALDPWEHDIAEYVRLTEKVKIPDILTKCLGLDASKKGKREQMRVAQVLTNLGWTKKRTKHERYWIKETTQNEASFTEGVNLNQGVDTDVVISKPSPSLPSDQVTTSDYCFKRPYIESSDIDSSNSRAHAHARNEVLEKGGQRWSGGHRPFVEGSSGVTTSMTTGSDVDTKKSLQLNDNKGSSDLSSKSSKGGHPGKNGQDLSQKDANCNKTLQKKGTVLENSGENGKKNVHGDDAKMTDFDQKVAAYFDFGEEKDKIDARKEILEKVWVALEKLGFKTVSARMAFVSNSIGRNIKKFGELSEDEFKILCFDIQLKKALMQK